jgi:O-antigen/teichoic acid export membrane protein
MLKNNHIKRLGKEMIWIIVGQIAAALGSLFGVRILTELMDPASYGEFTLGLTLTTLIGQLVLGPLSNGIQRFYSAAHEVSQLYSYFRAVGQVLIWATLSLVAMSLMFAAGCFFYQKTQWLALCLAAFGFALLSGYNAILSGIQNAARQRSIVALHQGLESWTRLGTAAALIVLIKANSLVAMLGYNISMLVLICSQLFFFKRILNQTNSDLESSQTSIKWRSKILTYSWPFATWGIFTWAQLVSDRWALELFNSTRDVGMYAVLYQLGYYPISLASGLFTQLIGPIFAKKAGDASDAQRMNHIYTLNWRLTLAVLALTLFAFALTWQFHDLIFSIFVAKQFSTISYLLPWMILSAGLYATGQTASISTAMSAETKTLLLPKICTALFGLTLNYLGAKHYGLIGVIGANLSFTSVYFLWIMLLNALKHRNLKREIIKEC